MREPSSERECRNGQPVSRRRVLTAGTAGLAVALAGCTGSGPSDAGANDVGTPTPDGNGGGNDGGGDSESGGSTPPDEFSCGAYEVRGTKPYDTSGTPLLVTFDVPESFERVDGYPESERFVEEIKSPIVEFNQVFLVVDQRYEPLTGEGVQQDIDQEVSDRSGGSSPAFAPVDSFAFAGETVDLYGTPEFPADGTVHAAWLPHETSEGKRYFKTFFGLSFSADFYEENEEGVPEVGCLDVLRAIADVQLGSLAPNPETTIDEAR